MRSVLLVALALVAMPTVLPGAALADGPESLGITPASLSLTDAQRGETYRRVVTVQNEFDTPTLVTLEISGPAGEWVSTQPASGFQVPPRTHAVLEVSVRVPADAANGVHAAHLRAVAEPKDQPEGSGFALRYAVAIPVDITVGGAQVMRFDWGHADAPDVEAETPPRVFVQVANAGNVRATARAAVDVVPFAGGSAVATAEGALELIPGESGVLEILLSDALPLGQYVASVRSEPPGAFEQVVEFKVLAPGSLQKSGVLRYLDHEAWVEPGWPVKITGVFENTGSVLLGRVKLTAEVYLDGRLVDVLTSEPMVVPAGEQVNLTAFFTPGTAGRYDVVGRVAYDGFEAMPSEGILNVVGAETRPASSPFFGLGWAGLAVAGVVGLALVHHRFGRRG